MGNSKVIFGDETLIDLTGDTVTSDTLLAGTTAHNRSGEQIVGTATVPDTLDDLTDVDITTPAAGDLLQYNATSQKWENSDVVPQELAAMQEAGAVNLFKVETTSQVVNGMTFTVNADSSISCADVATAVTSFRTGKATLSAGTYTISGCPINGGANTYKVQVYNRTTGSTIGYEYGNGLTFTLTTSAIIELYININVNIDMTGKAFYLMIYDARLVNPPYQPFTMTNRELTDSKADASDFNGLKVVIYKTTAPTVTTADAMRANIPGISTNVNLTMILGAWGRNNNNNVIYDVFRGNGLTEILYMNAYQLRNKTLPQDFVTTYGGNDFWAAIGYFPTTP